MRPISRPAVLGRARPARITTCGSVFRYINETALFKNQWQLKTASQADYLRLVDEKFRPILRKLEDEVVGSPASSHPRSSTDISRPERRKRRNRLRPRIQWRRRPADREGEPNSCDGVLTLHLPSPARRPRASPSPISSRRNRPARSTSSDSRSSLSARSQFRNSATVRRRRVHEISLPARSERRNRGGARRTTHKKMREELGIADEDAPEFAISSTKNTEDRDTRSDIPRARILRIRPSSSLCSSPKRMWACA